MGLGLWLTEETKFDRATGALLTKDTWVKGEWKGKSHCHTWAPTKFQQGGKKNSFREGDYGNGSGRGTIFEAQGMGR